MYLKKKFYLKTAIVFNTVLLMNISFYDVKIEDKSSTFKLVNLGRVCLISIY